MIRSSKLNRIDKKLKTKLKVHRTGIADTKPSLKISKKTDVSKRRLKRRCFHYDN